MVIIPLSSPVLKWRVLRILPSLWRVTKISVHGSGCSPTLEVDFGPLEIQRRRYLSCRTADRAHDRHNVVPIPSASERRRHGHAAIGLPAELFCATARGFGNGYEVGFGCSHSVEGAFGFVEIETIHIDAGRRAIAIPSTAAAALHTAASGRARSGSSCREEKKQVGVPSDVRCMR